MAKKDLSDIELEAVTLVQGEKEQWEQATTFVTDRVAFRMRDLIRTCRKNYWGIFDQEHDKITGKKKVWYPLTEINVEASVKNFDIDHKDQRFRAKTPEGYIINDLVRSQVNESLDEIYFGQTLDAEERTLAIDGTIVWKTWEEDSKPQRRSVDLLNFYIDPHAENIQSAYRVTERALMFQSEIEAMDWENTKMLKTEENLNPYDGESERTTAETNVEARDVWEMWGKMPKYLVTGKKKDKDVEIDGHIIVSGIDTGNPAVHLIEENTRKDKKGDIIKPYEEAWYRKIANRWYGKGVAEQLLMLQTYANLVLNIRINRATISQLGLFKVRKGSGITPQMLQRLGSNGAVKVSNMDDIEQFVVQDVAQSSYNDEEVIRALSERLTGAFEVATGETLPSSATATGAVISSRSTQAGFKMIRDGFGYFLERWMNRQWLPIIAKNIKKKDIVRFATDDDTMRALLDRVLGFVAQESLDEYYSQTGNIPSQLEYQRALEDAEQTLRARGDQLIEVVQEIVADSIDAQYYVTNEKLDVGVTIQNLLAIASSEQDPQAAREMKNMAIDLMGLPVPRTQAGAVQTGQQLPQGQPTPTPTGQTEQEIFTDANVPQF